jgi:hypothetical protein
MDGDALDYLVSRFYTEDLVRLEGLHWFPLGRHRLAGMEFGAPRDVLVFPCWTMSGALSGLHLVGYGDEKSYEWRRNPKAPWLPICYAAGDDWERLWETGEVVLVEGVFDRIALKRAFPELAVVARLSKSVASIQPVLERYATRIWNAFDADEEGEKGSRRLAYRLGGSRNRDCQVTRIRTKAKDPGDHARRYGLEDLVRHVKRQMGTSL